MTSPNYTHCNPGMLLEMVGGEKALFLELAEIFLRETLLKLEGIEAAAKAGDFSLLRHESHAMKGTVGPLGADALFEMVAAIEIECREDRCVCPPERVAALAEEVRLARNEVLAFIENL